MYWKDIELAEMHRKDMLREVQKWQLVQEIRNGRGRPPRNHRSLLSLFGRLIATRKWLLNFVGKSNDVQPLPADCKSTCYPCSDDVACSPC